MEGDYMKKQKFLWMAVVCTLLLSGCKGGGEALLLEAAASEEDSGAAAFGESGSETEKSDTVLVYICGAVMTPGVYEVEVGSRICDVLELAGGFSDDAGTDYLNLAETVSDGEKVYVPTVDELEVELAAEEEAAPGKININTATKEQLVTLPGIGESKADSIIAYRTEHGGFSSIEEIMEIPGIKDAVFSKIKELITVG
jgi:competence protein ComEA